MSVYSLDLLKEEFDCLIPLAIENNMIKETDTLSSFIDFITNCVFINFLDCRLETVITSKLISKINELLLDTKSITQDNTRKLVKLMLLLRLKTNNSNLLTKTFPSFELLLKNYLSPIDLPCYFKSEYLLELLNRM